MIKKNDFNRPKGAVNDDGICKDEYYCKNDFDYYKKYEGNA